MNSWGGPVLDPDLVEKCRAYAQMLSLGEETEEALANRKGIVRRVRISHGEQWAIRTDLRSMFSERMFVDAKPLGAVLVLLEIAKRQMSPRRLVVLTGDRAGEYADGAIEAAWGAIMLEGTAVNVLGLRFPGEPRRLDMGDLIALAESVL